MLNLLADKKQPVPCVWRQLQFRIHQGIQHSSSSLMTQSSNRSWTNAFLQDFPVHNNFEDIQSSGTGTEMIPLARSFLVTVWYFIFILLAATRRLSFWVIFFWRLLIHGLIHQKDNWRFMTNESKSDQILSHAVYRCSMIIISYVEERLCKLQWSVFEHGTLRPESEAKIVDHFEEHTRFRRLGFAWPLVHHMPPWDWATSWIQWGKEEPTLGWQIFHHIFPTI